MRTPSATTDSMSTARPRWRVVAALLGAGAATMAIAGPVSPAAGASPIASPIATGPLLDTDPAAVTLITGDIAYVNDINGHKTVTLTGYDGASGVAHATYTTPSGNVHLWPTTAIPSIGTLLDPDLFDVTSMLDAGYGDGATALLPLIIEHDGDVTLPAILQPSQAISPTELRVNVAVADRAPLGDLVRRAAYDPAALPGVTYIRLGDTAGGPEDAPARTAADHTLTIELKPYDAGGAFDGILLVERVGFYDQIYRTPVDETRATVGLELPDGLYHLSFVSQQAIDGDPALIDVSRNNVELHGDTTITLDSATANEITVDVGAPAARHDGAIGGLIAPTHDGGVASYVVQVNGADHVRLFAAPTDAPTDGQHVLATIQTLLTDGTSYHLDFEEPNGVPAELVYTPDPADLTTLRSSFHADVTGRNYLVRAIGYLGPWDVNLDGSVFPVRAASVHTMKVSWYYDHPAWNVGAFAGDREGSGTLLAVKDWEQGTTVDTTWFAPVVRPSTQLDQAMAYQVGDSVDFRVSSFVDRVGNSSVRWDDPDTEVDHLAYEVSVDGQQVAAGDGDLYAVDVPVPATPVPIEAYLATKRTASWWLSSPTTTTTWRFMSLPYDDVETRYPAMLTIDYGVDTDLVNRAAAPATITFHAYQPGEDALGIPIASLSAWTSIDGESWSELPVTGANGSYEATLTADAACADPCRISVRTLAEDIEGNSIDQTVTDAFVLGAAAPPTTTPTTSPTWSPSTSPTPTTTLPPTGSSSGVELFGLVALAIGGLIVAGAYRRLRMI